MMDTLTQGRLLWDELQAIPSANARALSLARIAADRDDAVAAAARVRDLHHAVSVDLHMCVPDCWHPMVSMPVSMHSFIVCGHCWTAARESLTFYRNAEAVAWPCLTSRTVDPSLDEVHRNHLDALSRSAFDEAFSVVTALIGDVPVLPIPPRPEPEAADWDF